MLLTLLLLVAAPPAPTPTYVPAAFRGRDYAAPQPVATTQPTPTIQQPRTLADVARERKLQRDGKTGGVFSAAENRGMYAQKDADAEIWTELKAKRAKEDEAGYWYGRVSDAETALTRAERELDRAKNTNVIGGSAISHSVAMASVAAQVEAAKGRVLSAQQHLDTVREEARKAGYPTVSTRPRPDPAAEALEELRKALRK